MPLKGFEELTLYIALLSVLSQKKSFSSSMFECQQPSNFVVP